MSANHRAETISEIAARGNIGVRCARCARKGVVDGPKAARYFFCHMWDGNVARAGVHFRCIECGGNGTRFALTFASPTVPEWGPQTEAEWKRLVARLSGWGVAENPSATQLADARMSGLSKGNRRF